MVSFLQTIGVVADGGHVLATAPAVIAGLTYNFLPFMILPLYASLERVDVRLIEAANDLYASSRTAFRKVTLPITAPGIVAGTLLTFIPAMGDYVNAFFLGGPNNKMIGNTIQSLYITQRDYPIGGRALVRAPGRDHGRRLDLHQVRRLRGAMGEEEAPRLMAWLRRNGLMIFAVVAVLYMLLPIAVIIGFSFNNPAGRYNFTWVGFTLEHWKNAFSIPDLNDALLKSLELAALATLISTILGTMIALALVRYEFFGRRSANFLIVIPMATPEVVIGAALLSMFLIYGINLGFTTLLIAHVMFCISFVVVVVRSRLIGFDRRLEEAAKDLGANAVHHLPTRSPCPCSRPA